MDLKEPVLSALSLIDMSLSEDATFEDVTTQAIIPHELEGQGIIVAKAQGIVAGLPILERVYKRIDPSIVVSSNTPEGYPVIAGDAVATVSGSLAGIITGERIGLNFLCHLSGIASLTSKFVDAVACYGTIIIDTRKTTPGWRMLEKYAVRVGGGRNHRVALNDMVLIKDNHIAVAGSVTEAIQRVLGAQVKVPIEVEVNNLSQLEEAISFPVDRILLDNMNSETMRKAVQLANKRVPLEASGGITLDKIIDVAATGVDYISIGVLTHSAPALDFSLEIVKAEE
jgi:nicotinate-nucleotide pyrophosphorylase (carboxylating)